ncbi:cysteine desulfurase-like protein [Streptomyces sp. NPDC057621]|uniref:cysteine desulfurase-like protein n=1 Tax=Streptomyces sp. NPDC057621 TaxID=3346186 RepID=UPI0036B48941
MTYDITALRAEFPALSAGIAHFDGPGGTQVPQPVIRAIADAMGQPLSIRGRMTPGERNAEAIVTRTRQALADLLGAQPGGIVFGRSATQLTYEFSRTLAKAWSPGDEVVVTRLDHDANIRPWVQAAEQAGATVRWADFDPATGELTADDIRAVLSPRTRLVAVTAASNLIGTRPPIAEICGLAHEVGALTYVDGVHHAAHGLVDLEELGADFFVCSPYKFFGPHHGVLAARPELLETLSPDKLLPSTDVVPERFELGTLPYEFLAGTEAAVDFLAGLDTGATGTRRQRLASAFTALEAHEQTLRTQLDKGLAALPGVQLHSRAADRTPTVLLTFESRPAAEAYSFLAERDVHAPAGSFYAIEASRRLGLGDTGGLRIGLAPYNSAEDIERLLTGLAEFLTR